MIKKCSRTILNGSYTFYNIGKNETRFTNNLNLSLTSTTLYYYNSALLTICVRIYILYVYIYQQCSNHTGGKYFLLQVELAKSYDIFFPSKVSSGRRGPVCDSITPPPPSASVQQHCSRRNCITVMYPHMYTRRVGSVQSNAIKREGKRATEASRLGGGGVDPLAVGPLKTLLRRESDQRSCSATLRRVGSTRRIVYTVYIYIYIYTIVDCVRIVLCNIYYCIIIIRVMCNTAGPARGCID